jgi:surface protein
VEAQPIPGLSFRRIGDYCAIFKTPQVKYLGNMFGECSSLTSINFANFDSNSAEDMGAMFFGCKN